MNTETVKWNMKWNEKWTDRRDKARGTDGFDSYRGLRWFSLFSCSSHVDQCIFHITSTSLSGHFLWVEILPYLCTVITAERVEKSMMKIGAVRPWGFLVRPNFCAIVPSKIIIRKQCFVVKLISVLRKPCRSGYISLTALQREEWPTFWHRCNLLIFNIV